MLGTSDDKALVQMFEGTIGLDVLGSKARFLGRSQELGVSPDLVGRIRRQLPDWSVNTLAQSVGAAVLALTSFQSGMSRLQSGRFRSASPSVSAFPGWL